MGLDGGTYITRSDVLRGASWALTAADTSRSTRGGNVQSGVVFQHRRLDRRTEKAIRWTTCALTGQPLQSPIAADWLGSLFNRAAVLEFLLGRAGVFADESAQVRYVNQLREGGLAFEHIRSKRDVFTVHPTERPTCDALDETSSRFVCSVTDLLCEQVPFSVLAPCGHIFSDRAIKQMLDATCSNCGTAFLPEEVVPLIGTLDQVQTQQDVLAQRQQRREIRRAGDGSKKKRKSEPIPEIGGVADSAKRRQ